MKPRVHVFTAEIAGKKGKQIKRYKDVKLTYYR
jgi:hypothetical protein